MRVLCAPLIALIVLTNGPLAVAADEPAEGVSATVRLEIRRTIECRAGRRPSGIDLSPDGRLIAAKCASWYLVWDVATGKGIRSIADDPRNGYQDVHFINGGTQLIGNRPNSVGIWNLEDGKLARWVPRRLSRFSCSPNERFIAGSIGGNASVHLHDLRTNKSVSLAGHKETPMTIAFSPNSRLLATGGLLDKKTFVWDVATGKKRAIQISAKALQFSPDSRQLAIGGVRGELMLWDGRKKQAVFIVENAHGILYSVAFSPDGTLLATSGADKKDPIRFWNPKTGERIEASMPPAIGSTHILRFGPGNTLIAGQNEPRIEVLSYSLVAGEEVRN